MRQPELTKDSPFILRMQAYLRERFPLYQNILLIICYYSSNQFLAQALCAQGQLLHLTWWSFFGGLCLLSCFFYLRVFDEHKDFYEDNQFFPERVLQRGVVSLKELRFLGAIAITAHLGLSLLHSAASFITALLVFAYSLLMLKEFFCAAWLKKHFLLYTMTHMLIMPLYSLQIFSFTTGKYFYEAPMWYLAYSVVGFFVTLNWEISRKIRAPDEEVAGLSTYTQILGTYGAGYAVLFVRVIDTALVAAVGYHLGLSSLFYFLLIVLFCVCLYGFIDFRLHTSSTTARRMELYAAIYIIAFDLILTVELMRKYWL